MQKIKNDNQKELNEIKKEWNVLFEKLGKNYDAIYQADKAMEEKYGLEKAYKATHETYIPENQ